MDYELKVFFDEATFTLTYVVYDSNTRDAVIIDPVLDYEPQGGGVSGDSVRKLNSFIKETGLNVRMILETHAHADHLTGAQELKAFYPEAKLAIGKNITKVQSLFKGIFNLPDRVSTDGSQFDLLLNEGEPVTAGSISFDVLFTPGHTPACSSYKFGDSVFTGDAIFMPDYGTGRCDFPAGSAEDLYDSITQKLYTLPDDTKLYVGHDYLPGGRELRYETTVGEEKKHNVQLPANRSKHDFVRFRSDRDKTLKAPKLLYPSVQVNVDGGRLPEPEGNGTRYLKIPLTIKDDLKSLE